MFVAVSELAQSPNILTATRFGYINFLSSENILFFVLWASIAKYALCVEGVFHSPDDINTLNALYVHTDLLIPFD